jgi:glycosyltransferase involved in cell wall biosynthesis
MVYVHHLPSVLRRKADGGRLVAGWEPLAIRLLRRATLVVVIENHDVSRELIARGIPVDRLQPTCNGVESAPTGPTERHRSDEVVYCGRITDSKGWQDLLIIGERLRQLSPGTVLRVLGEGERRSDLERAITARQLGDVVRVEGFVDDNTKWHALQRAAAFVSPSREEGWGIAVSEALSAGAEVVAYDLPAYRVFHGRQLHMVPVGDVEALALQLAKVVREPAHQPNEDFPLPSVGMKSWDEIARHELRLADGLTGVGRTDTDEMRSVAR